MLNENIKLMRKSKGFSQDELAVKLNVVRQTVSKWERGLSVPDSEMLLTLSEILETPVSNLLGENIIENKSDDLKIISEKLEVINLQLARREESKRKIAHWTFVTIACVIIFTFIGLSLGNSSYLNWDYRNPETAVMGVVFHAIEWVFVRVAPIMLVGLIIGIVVTRRKSK